MTALLIALWWLLLILAAWGLAAGIAFATPQELAMLLGFAGFWLAALEPYRYAFYAVYLLLLLVVLAGTLVVPLPSMWAWISGTSLIEGVFWGASIVALLVWALGAAATVLTAKLAAGAAAPAESQA